MPLHPHETETSDITDDVDTTRVPAAVTGHADPDGEAPWAMQIVARVEKTDPPSHTATCEAAAMAVASLLGDERAQPDGEWFPAIERWVQGRIRKHARKARGAAWDKVQAFPGVTVTHAGAQVRAFLPCATDTVPRDIAKLQMQGFVLDDPDRRRHCASTVDGPVVVSICPDPPLPTGKAAAAAGHAAQLAQMRMPPERLVPWLAARFPVLVEHPDPAEWADLVATCPVVVADAGFTEVAPGTVTAVARWS